MPHQLLFPLRFVTIFTGLLLPILISLSGCATAPAYTYIRDENSAELRGHRTRGLFLDPKQAEVDIARINGISIEKVLAFDEPRYVEPGTHLVQLKLIHYDINCYPTFELSFKPAHHYLFEAVPSKDDFEVIVYESKGSSKPRESVILHALVPRRRIGEIIFLPIPKSNRPQ